MGARYFQFSVNAAGVIFLAGLSPDETFELEYLLNQHDTFRSSSDRVRLDALCEKHCHAVAKSRDHG